MTETRTKLPHPLDTAADMIKCPEYGIAVLDRMARAKHLAIDQLSGITPEDTCAVVAFLRNLADAIDQSSSSRPRRD